VLLGLPMALMTWSWVIPSFTAFMALAQPISSSTSPIAVNRVSVIAYLPYFGIATSANNLISLLIHIGKPSSSAANSARLGFHVDILFFLMVLGRIIKKIS
jgi:hypothetical protein